MGENITTCVRAASTEMPSSSLSLDWRSQIRSKSFSINNKWKIRWDIHWLWYFWFPPFQSIHRPCCIHWPNFCSSKCLNYTFLSKSFLQRLVCQLTNVCFRWLVSSVGERIMRQIIATFCFSIFTVKPTPRLLNISNDSTAAFSSVSETTVGAPRLTWAVLPAAFFWSHRLYLGFDIPTCLVALLSDQPHAIRFLTWSHSSKIWRFWALIAAWRLAWIILEDC